MSKPQDYEYKTIWREVQEENISESAEDGWKHVSSNVYMCSDYKPRVCTVLRRLRPEVPHA